MRISKMVVFLVLLMLAGGVLAAEKPSLGTGESLFEAIWDVIVGAFADISWPEPGTEDGGGAADVAQPGRELGRSLAWIDPVGLTFVGDPPSEQEDSENAGEADED